MYNRVRIENYEYNPNTTPLGAGKFGKVYAGTDLQTNTPVAIKVVVTSDLNQEYSKWFQREKSILKALKTDYALEVRDVIEFDGSKICIITNLCTGGSLETILTTNKTLSEIQALKMLSQVAEAFVNLQNGSMVDNDQQKMIVMHRDLKPANILFHEGDVCIADFGTAKYVQESLKETREKHTVLGTPHYMSPQILAENNYSTKCDIWSMGVVMYESLFGKKPWDAGSTYKLLDTIRTTGLRFPAKPAVSESTQDLIKSMLQLQEDERIDWEGILKHHLLAKYRLKNKEEKEKKLKARIEKENAAALQRARMEQENQRGTSLGSLEENEMKPSSRDLTEEISFKPQKNSQNKIDEETKGNSGTFDHQHGQKQQKPISRIQIIDQPKETPTGDKHRNQQLAPQALKSNDSVSQKDPKVSQETQPISDNRSANKKITILSTQSDALEIKRKPSNPESHQNPLPEMQIKNSPFQSEGKGCEEVKETSSLPENQLTAQPNKKGITILSQTKEPETMEVKKKQPVGNLESKQPQENVELKQLIENTESKPQPQPEIIYPKDDFF